MAESATPVSREQAFLETYFQCLQKFAYDKAKELCDKEREALRPHPISAWSMLVVILGGLATAERTYSSLLFLTQNLSAKFFGRKENLKTNLNCYVVDLRKIEEGSQRSLPPGETGENLEQLFGHLSGQLCEYITARSKLADFYEKMLEMSQSKCVVFEDLQVIITEVQQSYQKSFHHPILSPIRSNFSLECDILTHLIQAQVRLQNWQFLQCLLQLNDASAKLANWATLSTAREVKRLGFSAPSRAHQLPVVYQWLSRLKALLVAKCGLYFHDVLSRHGPAPEVKALMAKASVDFYGKIAQFQRKTDATSVCLVLDTNPRDDRDFVYHGAGYHHPDTDSDPPQGLDSYPTIFSYPGERPDRLWPSVVSILTAKCTELDAYDRPVYFCDESTTEKKLPASYFMTRVEPRITLVILFDSKKSERDSYVNTFIMDISLQLRCSKLCASLKPGVK